jgi:hypothetical protein
MGHPGFGTLAECASWLALIPSLVVFAPRWGIEGVAAALLVSSALSLAVLALAVILPRRILAVRPWFRAQRSRARFAISRKKASIALFFVAPALAIAVGAFVGWTATSAVAEFLVLALATVAATVAAFVVGKRKLNDAASPLGLVTVFYALGFGVGAIYFWFRRDATTMQFSRLDLTVALALGALAWLMTVVGYVANPLRRLLHAMPQFAPRLPSPIATSAVLLIVGWLARAQLARTGHYFHTVRAGQDATAPHVSWLFSSLATLPTIAAALIGASAWMEPTYRRLRKLYWVLIAVEVLWYVPSGDRGSLVGLALTVLLVQYYGAGKKLPVLAFSIAAAAAVFIVFPLGLNYRGDNADYQTHPKQSLAHAYNDWSSGSVSGIFGNGVKATFSRFSDAASVAVIVNQGRGRLDRRPTETLGWSLEAFVPRAFMPSKPDPGAFGNEFGRKFGILHPDDRITSIAVTTVGEFYLSFGVLGILLLMPLCGAVYRAIDHVLSARDRSPAVLAMYSVAAWPLVQSPGTIFALGSMGLIKLLAFYATVLLILGTPIRVLRHRPAVSVHRSPAGGPSGVLR